MSCQFTSVPESSNYNLFQLRLTVFKLLVDFETSVLNDPKTTLVPGQRYPILYFATVSDSKFESILLYDLFRITGHFETVVWNESQVTLSSTRSYIPYICPTHVAESQVSFHFAQRSVVFKLQPTASAWSIAFNDSKLTSSVQGQIDGYYTCVYTLHKKGKDIKYP